MKCVFRQSTFCMRKKMRIIFLIYNSIYNFNRLLPFYSTRNNQQIKCNIKKSFFVRHDKIIDYCYHIFIALYHLINK